MEKIDYLVLIRGMNAGSKNVIKMDKLKEIFVNMDFSDVETYIQTGNVFLKDNENDVLKLTEKIEETLSKKIKNEIKVVIVKINELKNIIKNAPNGFGEENDKYKYDIMFLIEPLKTKEIMNGLRIIENEDEILEGKNVFYVKRFSKKLTGSYITQIVNKWSNITVRNFKITKELYELMLRRKENMK